MFKTIFVREGLNKDGEFLFTTFRSKEDLELNFRGVKQDVIMKVIFERDPDMDPGYKGYGTDPGGIEELNINMVGPDDENDNGHEVTIIIDGLTDLEKFVCTGSNLSWIVKFSANGCNSLKYLRVDGNQDLSGLVGCPITTVDISGNLMEQLGNFTNIEECEICCDSESEFYPDSLPYSCTHLGLIQPPFPQNLDESDAVSDESDEESDPDMDYRYRGFGIPKPDKKKCLSAKYVSDISDLKDRCPDLKEFTTNSMIVIPDKDKWIINRRDILYGYYEERRQIYKLK